MQQQTIYDENTTPAKRNEKDVYICHSDKDQRHVDYLCKRFDEQGIDYTYSGQKIGQKDPSELIEIIQSCRIILFVATYNSYHSPFAVKELVYATNHIDPWKIIIYHADDAKVPDNIRLITQKENLIESNHHFVSVALMQRLCNLLNREMKPFDESEDDDSISDTHVTISLSIMLGLPILGIALAIIIGIWQQSTLLGISIFLAFLGFLFTFSFASILDYSFRTPIGKVMAILTYAFCTMISAMIPISTWIGIESNSWTTGLTWLGISWTILFALLTLAYEAKSSISINRIALSSKKKPKTLYDFYICSDPKDHAIVERIKMELRRNGITYTSSNETSVENGVQSSCGFLYVGSKACYLNEQCNKELIYGFNHRRPILAYAVDQTEMPEEKKLAFSNSNIRTLNTHPIETSLMSDLKEILETVQTQHPIKIESSFWHLFACTAATVLVIVATILAGLLIHSISVVIFVFFLLIASIGTIYENRTKRRIYTRHVSKDITIVDFLLILTTPILPVFVWWLFSPGPWMIVLFCFVGLVLTGIAAGFVEHLTKYNPIGRLSPKQIDQYYDVFISYSRKNTIHADQVCALFDKERISYFIDRQGIPGGAEFPTVLAVAIKNCGLFLFLVSDDSMSSKFCFQELQYANQHKSDNDVLPLFVDEETEKRCQDICTQNGVLQDSDNIIFINMSADNWEQQLMTQIRTKLPESQQYKTHQIQTSTQSLFSNFKHSMQSYFKEISQDKN